jgi:hypothetical protein
MLGFSGELAAGGWRLRLAEPGQKLPPPEPLFKKLEEEVIARETTRQGLK